MNRFTLLMLGCLIMSTALAQKTLPYKTSFENSSEQAGWTPYRKGARSPNYKWDFTSVQAKDGSKCLSHYYPVGGTELTIDWMVSPALDLAQGATIGSLWYAFAGFGTPQEGDTLALYLLEGDQDPEKASKKTRIILFSDKEYKNDNTWRNKTDVTIPPTVGKAYIAFRYETTSNWLDVRFDKLEISGNATTSQEPVVKPSSKPFAYPNPFKDRISIPTEKNGSPVRAAVIDAFGRTAWQGSTANGQVYLGGLKPGVYFLRVESSNGIRLQRITKQ